MIFSNKYISISLIIVFQFVSGTLEMYFEQWTPQEDEFIQSFVSDIQKLSWDQVSEKMMQILNLPKKTGKECQQRYQQLTSTDSVLKIEWNEAQEQTLIQKHREMGNKWAAISHYLNGKNDNCVKNHFYSRLRKMIRKLNRIIQIYFKKIFRAIPNSTIYKLVQASEERFKQKVICAEEVSIVCQDVISKMLRISVQEEARGQDNQKLDKNNLNEYHQLIEQINKANKNYKKKSKKIKNSTIKAPVRRIKGSKAKKMEKQMQQEYKADQSSSQSEQEVQQIQKSAKKQTRFQNDIAVQVLDAYILGQVKIAKKVQIKEGDEMQELLKNIGLLYQGKNIKKKTDKASQFGNNSMKSYSDFQNQSQDLSFFDDSNNCWKKQSQMFSRINRNLFGDNSSQVEGL